jgi:hypothetical protein
MVPYDFQYEPNWNVEVYNRMWYVICLLSTALLIACLLFSIFKPTLYTTLFAVGILALIPLNYMQLKISQLVFNAEYQEILARHHV